MTPKQRSASGQEGGEGAMGDGLGDVARAVSHLLEAVHRVAPVPFARQDHVQFLLFREREQVPGLRKEREEDRREAVEVGDLALGCHRGDRFAKNRARTLAGRDLRPALVLVGLAPEAASSAVFRSTTLVVSHDGCTPTAFG
jgi:hypothetical protein